MTCSNIQLHSQSNLTLNTNNVTVFEEANDNTCNSSEEFRKMKKIRESVLFSRLLFNDQCSKLF